MFRKLLNYLDRKTSNNTNKTQDLVIKPSKKTNSYNASSFEDIIEGFQFSPTFLFRTPSETLRANGIHVKHEEDIPDFLKEQRHGVWLPKVSEKYTLSDNTKVGASDAHGADRDDYIKFVCSIKDIYYSDSSIFERASRIDNFIEKHPELRYIEEKLLKYYGSYDSVIDILMFHIDFSLKDITVFYFKSEGYLKQIFEINSRIEKALLNSDYKVAEDVIYLTKKQLIELDGVGNKSAEKILKRIEEVKHFVSDNL